MTNAFQTLSYSNFISKSLEQHLYTHELQYSTVFSHVVETSMNMCDSQTRSTLIDKQFDSQNNY